MWIIGILPCVVITSLETGAFMAVTACIDMLMVRRNPARSRRKRVLKEQLRRKRGPRLCISKFRSKEVYSAESWATRLNASAGHAIKFSGRTWYEVQIRERELPSRGVIPKGEPHERNPCAPRFGDKKYTCSRPRTKQRFILLSK